MTPSGRRTLRIASWNLWGCFGNWTERRRPIEAVLAQLDPDIVGLQEVWGTEEESLASELAARLGMHHVWCPSPVSPRWSQDASSLPQ